MPKKEMDYSKMVIYKICCKDLNITDIYIGHTTNLVKRRWKHKSNCCCENNINYNIKVYQFIRNNGGWDNWEIIEIDRCPCLDFEEAKKIEREYIEKLNPTLNTIIPLRTSKQWHEDNKEKIKEYNKKPINIEKNKVQCRDYYYRNKDILLEKAKEKITCQCGCLIGKYDIQRHKKTEKHIRLMEQLIKSVSF